MAATVPSQSCSTQVRGLHRHRDDRGDDLGPSLTPHFTDEETEAGWERHAEDAQVSLEGDKQGSPPMVPYPLPQHRFGQLCKVHIPEPPPPPTLLRWPSWGRGLEMNIHPTTLCDTHWLWEALGVEGLGVGADRSGFESHPCCSLALHLQLKSPNSISSAVMEGRAAKAIWTVHRGTLRPRARPRDIVSVP